MAPGRPRPAAAADARYKDDDAPDNDQDWHKDDEQEEEGYDPDTNETRQRNHATAKNKTNASNKTKETLSSATTTTGNSSRSTGSKRHKLRRVNFDAENDDLDFLPSHERATEAGGYMHTKNSRWKISQANKGKMPWNKGKNRSDTAKAKISAGVRARNRALLLDKLTALNMSEEEWLAKKRQIKLLRERVRKAKLVAEKHQQQLCHHQLQTSGVGVGTNTSSTGGELTLSSAQIHSQLQQQLNELVHQISVKDEYDEDGNDNSNICLMVRAWCRAIVLWLE